MENQIGLRAEELAELRKFRALVDDVVGNLRRQWQLSDEEENETRRMEMKRQIFKNQDEFMECVRQTQDKIKEINSDISKEKK